MRVGGGEAARPADLPAGGRLFLYAALAALAVTLALARLATGGWYLTYNPAGTRLLEEWPIAWEAIYYLVHFPTFLGDGPPELGIAPVHYRNLVHLYLVTTLYAWTGSAFWSLAAFDLFFWCLAAVAGYHVALRLGAEPWAAVLGALTLGASPILVSNMWSNLFHVANFATMPLGLWAALVLVDEHRSRWRLTVGLGFLLLVLSLSYQYQWLLLPMLAVIAGTSGRLPVWQGVIVVAGALLLFLGGTAALKAVLAAAGLAPTAAYSTAVAEPQQLLAAHLASLRAAGDVGAALPRWPHIQLTAQVYHPAVYICGLIGLGLLPSRSRWLALMALGGTLLAVSLYGPPWTAMSAYPFMYAGVGASCAAGGGVAARAMMAVPWVRGHAGRRSICLARAVSLGITVVCAALTNQDLLGDPRFLLMWWDYYAERALF